MTHQHVYKLLKQIGMSPFKAAEIVLDASRGDKYALKWIKIAFGQRHFNKVEQNQ